MKKILFLILMLASIFTLTSCKKNEPVGRVTANFLSDFKLETTDDFDVYDAIIKDMEYSNRTNNFKTALRMLQFNFTTNRKVVIKKISYRLYNHSETETLKILVNKESIYSMNDNDTCSINYFNQANEYTVEDLEPNSYRDITLNLENLKLKKKSSIMLLFGYTLDASHYGIDMETATMEERKEPINRLRNCAGICNFNIDYIAYIKV